MLQVQRDLRVLLAQLVQQDQTALFLVPQALQVFKDNKVNRVLLELLVNKAAQVLLEQQVRLVLLEQQVFLLPK